jgi:ribonuclease HI
MSVPAPHYLLFSESEGGRVTADTQQSGGRRGQWRFVLETVDGSSRLEAADEEADLPENRLELLAVVRGLEALGQPSRVTLVTPSRYVNRGFRYGLDQWRENGWCWERFGEMTPIKNRDLWQRVDRAMQYHQVECRVWRFDLPEKHVGRPKAARATRSAQRAPLGRHPSTTSRRPSLARKAVGLLRRLVSETLDSDGRRAVGGAGAAGA